MGMNGANLDTRGNNFSGSVVIVQPLAIGGLENFAADYSAGAQVASFAPGVYTCFQISYLQIIMSWTNVAPTAIDWQKFAKLVALTNGIVISITGAGITYNLTTNPITCNGQLPDPVVTYAVNSVSLVATVPCAGANVLNGNAGESISATLHDNFSTLDTLRFNAVGYYGNMLR